MMAYAPIFPALELLYLDLLLYYYTFLIQFAGQSQNIRCLFGLFIPILHLLTQNCRRSPGTPRPQR